jgi:hypothetical protein
MTRFDWLVQPAYTLLMVIGTIVVTLALVVLVKGKGAVIYANPASVELPSS